MLSFSYKWMGNKIVRAKGLPDYPLYQKDKYNDRDLIKDLWDLFDEANVLVAHNGDRFDIRKANARFAAHGLKPPSPYRTVDTLKLARKTFMLNSNKLDDIGKYLGIGKKLETGGFDLWLSCLAGDKKAWKKMIAYNKQDVALLEDVYYALRPWATTYPNMNVINDTTESCPACGGKNLQKRGFSITKVGKYQRYCCQDCGKWSRGDKLNGRVITR